jgi:hypothetical protein
MSDPTTKDMTQPLSPASEANKPPDAAVVAHGSDKAGASCVFCQLAASAHAAEAMHTRILFSDELVYVIADRTPGARLHLLVNAREHVRDCKTLDSEELGRLQVSRESVRTPLCRTAWLTRPCASSRDPMFSCSYARGGAADA